MSPTSAGWRPEEHWEPLPGGRGPSTAGLWIDRSTDPVSVVKRVRRPVPDDPAELDDPGHAAWWRRPALVAGSGVVTATPGLRAQPALELSEDDDGYVVREPLAGAEELPGPFLAASLARFAAARAPDVPWLARDPLGDRLTRVAWGGGWRTLARTGAADVADRLWARRRLLLARTGELPQVLQHGDPVPANFACRVGPAVIAHDWGGLGLGPVGADLGYLSLSSRESLEVLAGVYHQELPRGLCTLDEVMLAARVTSVYTVLNRAEWALSRVADGEGPLGAKLRHPSVAPSLRALQRQAPHVEALLGV